MMYKDECGMQGIGMRNYDEQRDEHSESECGNPRMGALKLSVMNKDDVTRGGRGLGQ